MVRRYHVYRAIWEAAVGETLNCAREVGNRSDTFAVAVIKGGDTVGHVPRRISSICSIFLKNTGLVYHSVTFQFLASLSRLWNESCMDLFPYLKVLLDLEDHYFVLKDACIHSSFSSVFSRARHWRPHPGVINQNWRLKFWRLW